MPTNANGNTVCPTIKQNPFSHENTKISQRWETPIRCFCPTLSQKNLNTFIRMTVRSCTDPRIIKRISSLIGIWKRAVPKKNPFRVPCILEGKQRRNAVSMSRFLIRCNYGYGSLKSSTNQYIIFNSIRIIGHVSMVDITNLDLP